MVETATSLGRSGLQDWLIQRATALILAAYTAFLLGYLIMHPSLQYETWRALFFFQPMRYVSLLAVLSLMAHAWIGIWTVSTDYVKPVTIRFFLQAMILIALLGLLLWGIQIIWSI